jgi:hypothetical protein
MLALITLVLNNQGALNANNKTILIIFNNAQRFDLRLPISPK